MNTYVPATARNRMVASQCLLLLLVGCSIPGIDKPPAQTYKPTVKFSTLPKVITTTIPVTVAWNKQSVDGYRLWAGTNSRSYQIVLDCKTNNYGVLNLQKGVKYYIAATAYKNGIESDYSIEITYTTPSVPINYPSNTIINISLDFQWSTNLAKWNTITNIGSITITNPIGVYNYRGLMHITSTNL